MGYIADMKKKKVTDVMGEFNVALVQASPELFRRDAGVDSVIGAIGRAAREDVRLVVFPEAIIPGYPRGFIFGCSVGGRSQEGRRLWRLYYENSLEIPGPETERIGKAAKKARVYVALGVTERTRLNGSLYCTMVIFGPDGRLLHRHRKIKPTAAERIIWAEGDGSDLTVLETGVGRLGGLICWENYMPLARMALYNQGIQVYLAPTADSRDAWVSSLIHIACEGRCFVLGCNQFMTREMAPSGIPCYEELQNQPEIMCRGGSMVVSPLGGILAGPLYDREGVLTARIDLSEITRAHLDFDAVGHYQRPDLFQFFLTPGGGAKC